MTKIKKKMVLDILVVYREIKGGKVMSKQHNMLQISERSLSRAEGREQQRSNNNKNKQTHPYLAL